MRVCVDIVHFMIKLKICNFIYINQIAVKTNDYFIIYVGYTSRHFPSIFLVQIVLCCNLEIKINLQATIKSRPRNYNQNNRNGPQFTCVVYSHGRPTSIPDRGFILIVIIMSFVCIYLIYF